VVLLAVIGLAILAVVYRSNLESGFEALLDWARTLGPWGAAVVGVAYIPVCLLMLPGSPLTLGAGFLFGLAWGTAAVSLGSTIGACCAFLVGRFLARDWVAARLEGFPRFRAIDRAVGEHGFKIVVLTRLSPAFPFNVLNYAYGLTDVSFRNYAIGSWLGMLPGTLMYVYFGSAAKSLADILAGKAQFGDGGRVLFFVGLVATLVVTVLVTRLAQGALRDSVAVDPASAANRDDTTGTASTNDSGDGSS